MGELGEFLGYFFCQGAKELICELVKDFHVVIGPKASVKRKITSSLLSQ
jgi:hypothetical protein